MPTYLPPQPIMITKPFPFNAIPFTTITTAPTPVHLHPHTEVGHITHHPLNLTQHTISATFTRWNHTIPGTGHTWHKLESALLIPRDNPETGFSVPLRAFPQARA